MASNNAVTFVGQIMKPELRYTNSGKAVASTRMVVKTPGEGDDMWINVVAWENLAVNLNVSFPENSKTLRVVVTGRMQENSWQGKDGNTRKNMEVVADNIAVSLDYATVNGVQYSGDGATVQSSNYNNNTEMAKDILGATEPPVARTDYGEDEAPF
jgi:single-strand DNA-binding protein